MHLIEPNTPILQHSICDPLCTDPASTAILQSWTFEPWIIIPLLLAGAIYLRGWWQLHRRIPRRFSVWRLIAFQSGLLALFLALDAEAPWNPAVELPPT